MSKGGSTDKQQQSGTTTQQVTVDPRSQAQIDLMRQFGAAGAGGIAGLDPNVATPEAFTAAQNALLGQIGSPASAPRASGGSAQVADFGFNQGDFDFGSVSQFLDPYLSQVVGASQDDFARQRELAGVQGNQMATQGDGAFGFGNRSALFGSELQGGINRNEASQLAQLRSSGFNTAVGRALGLFEGQENRALGAASEQFRGANQIAMGNAANATQASIASTQAASQAEAQKTQNILAALGAGAQEFGFGQQNLQNQFNQFTLPGQLLAGTLGPFGTNTRGTANSQSTTKEGGGGFFNSLLGAGLTAASFI